MERSGACGTVSGSHGGYLLNAIETRRLAGLTRAEWLRLCERGAFPRPRRQGAKILWREDEVRAWLDRLGREVTASKASSPFE